MCMQGATISLDREYRQLVEQYCDELMGLADAMGLESDSDDHFFWVVEAGTRVVFSLSSSGLVAASERMQQYVEKRQ